MGLPGPFTARYTDGSTEHSHFSNGKQHGTSDVALPNGSRVRLCYSHGKRHGVERRYTKDGKRQWWRTRVWYRGVDVLSAALTAVLAWYIIEQLRWTGELLLRCL